MAGTLAVAFLLPSAISQGQARRPFDPTIARRSTFRAMDVLREPSPAAAQQLNRLVSQAEVVTADERTAPVWEQVPGRVEAAWNRALVMAKSSLAEFRGREGVEALRWADVAESTAADVRRAQIESNEAGVGQREISAARQAAIKWELAETYAGQRQYQRATLEAEAARGFADEVHRAFLALHSRYEDPKSRAFWRRLASETIAQSKRDGSTVFIVDKLNRKLHVYIGGRRVDSVTAELGSKGLKRKLHAGDQATPEGRYRITETRDYGRTNYYKALMLDYPNAEDRARYAHGRRTGEVPARAGIGSLIEIHGEGGQGRDWTDGCVALRNRDMDRIFARARVGTPVTIVGTF
ncbi:MAG: murein L,D-transpeptidase family protein [Thermoanaerobaculia bacterium]